TPMANQRTKVKDLPCIFFNLVHYYKDQSLSTCDIPPNSEHWRNANTPAVTKKLQAFQDLIPELRDRQFS
ncbi:6957_t:CDS:1, partial [Dentiscutata erythropus]